MHLGEREQSLLALRISSHPPPPPHLPLRLLIDDKYEDQELFKINYCCSVQCAGTSALHNPSIVLCEYGAEEG